MAALKKEQFAILSESRVLIALPIHTKLYLKGKVQVESIVKNAIEIFGANFNAKSEFPIDVYSPKGYSLLYFEAIEDSKHSTDLKNYDDKKDQKILKRFSIQYQDCSLFILNKMTDQPWTDYVEDLLKYSDSKKHKMALFGKEKWVKDDPQVPEPIEDILDISLFVAEEFEDFKARLLNKNPQWDYALQSVQIAQESGRHPKIIGTGGKGVGKSTTLKYISNKLLEHGQAVLWIDLDPGQAEFTLPGMLSATLLDKPILGPNFTHLDRQVVFSVYLGSVNVSDVLHRYRKGREELSWFLQDSKYSDVPWIINTMGFNRGLGLTLLKETMQLFQPTTLIEIKSRHPKKNYEVNMTEMLQSDSNYLEFQAMPEDTDKEMNTNDLWGIPEPYKLRDIVILAHLAKSGLLSKIPYSVSFQDLKVQIVHCNVPRQVELVLNTALVSFGYTNDTKNIVDKNVVVPSQGFGIIRAVDPKRQLFYVLTDLDPEQLQNINCVTAGSIFLPNGVFTSKIKNKLDRSTPYVQEKPALETPLNIPWQRSGKPRLPEFQSKNK